MTVIKAMEPGERAVIRGKVVTAYAFFWKDGKQLVAEEFPKWKIPYQTNNLTAWYREATKVVGAPMRPMLGYELGGESIEISVNDGLGAKVGRGSNENEFTFTLWENGVATAKLLIKVVTEPHQKSWARKKEAGYVAPPRRKWTDITYQDLSEGKIFQKRDGVDGHLIWDPEEYFREFPEHRGNIPVKQAQ